MPNDTEALNAALDEATAQAKAPDAADNAVADVVPSLDDGDVTAVVMLTRKAGKLIHCVLHGSFGEAKELAHEFLHNTPQ